MSKNLSQYEVNYLNEARKEFEKQIRGVLVQIDFDNKLLVVQTMSKDIDLLKAYELKEMDSDYQDWIDNFKLHLLAEYNKRLPVSDINKEDRNFNQRCAACGKPNRYGDLNCSECYERIDNAYLQEQETYKKPKIKH